MQSQQSRTFRKFVCGVRSPVESISPLLLSDSKRHHPKTKTQPKHKNFAPEKTRSRPLLQEDKELYSLPFAANETTLLLIEGEYRNANQELSFSVCL